MKTNSPLLSIGIIFKNEIRCLERCMKSLQPLRDAIPCELVMADTGSDDGSRAVAEKYADQVFDFPWINDFAAARNAVMDRCSGEWYLTVDCDEWLDPDIARLVRFLTTEQRFNFASLVVRNYKSLELEKSGLYSDFAACRILRMSTGVRFEGAIHEHWTHAEGSLHIQMLEHTILHHDGYIFSDPKDAEKKVERNMTLLRAELEKDPDSLLLLMQCIESGSGGTPEYMDYVHRALEGVREKRTGWNLFGPSILRHAVTVASGMKLPELDEWIALAEETFPDSIFTRVDVAYIACGAAFNKGDYAGCIRRGEQYLRGLEDFERRNFNQMDMISSSVTMVSPYWKQNISIYLAAAYLFEHKPEECGKMLHSLDTAIMDIQQVGNFVRSLVYLHGRSELDTAGIIVPFWEKLSRPEPTQKKAQERCHEFQRMASGVFDPVYREGEGKEEDYCRHSYTVFLPLAGKCAAGDAAAILEEEDPAKIAEILSRQEDFQEMPIFAIRYALEHGVKFPLPGKPLRMEDLGALAARLVQDNTGFTPKLWQYMGEMEDQSGQKLFWQQSLIVNAVAQFHWKAESPDVANGLAVVHAYAKTMGTFLPRYYAPELLRSTCAGLFPPFHRFGFYCTQAFGALDAGDGAGYVRLLREGLEVCPGMKDVVEFLLEHTPQLQAPPEPSEELKALADQIRAVLANFSPGDPAVAALKQSEAYQKVAYLIEGMDVPVVGGLKQ